MLVRTFASAVTGIDAVTVTIEVNVSRGIQFFLVGLPDSAVKESQHRIASALRCSELSLAGKAGSDKYGTGRYQERRIGI